MLYIEIFGSHLIQLKTFDFSLCKNMTCGPIHILGTPNFINNFVKWIE